MRTLVLLCLCFGWSVGSAHGAHVEGGRLVLDKGDVITVVGNTFAERMIHHPHFEASCQTAYPDHEIAFRNLAWSGDEVALQPRPLNFGTMDEHIRRTGADVLIGCFGMNESFGGYEGLPKFRKDLGDWLDEHQALSIDGTAPVLVLVSPIAHENLGPPLPDGRSHTHVLARYRDVMRDEALQRGVLFVDLLRPTARAMAAGKGALTVNGIHPNDDGYQLCAAEFMLQLGFPDVQRGIEPGTSDALLDAIRRRNNLFFQRWRPTNTEYVYGRRHKPYGNHNFPGEMQELDRLVKQADTEIHATTKAVSK